MKEVHIPGLAGTGEEFINRLSLRFVQKRAIVYHSGNTDLVVKVATPSEDVPLSKLRDEQAAQKIASRYLPVAETLFVYMRDEHGKKSVVRIQKHQGETLGQVSDVRLSTPWVKAQLLSLVQGARAFMHDTGINPDLQGHLKRFGIFPVSLRRSTNILIDSEDTLRLVDVVNSDIIYDKHALFGGIFRTALFVGLARLEKFASKKS